jgi:hypothetical protein
MTAIENDLLKAALDYEARGFSVIPLHGIVGGQCTCRKPACDGPGKHPIGPWKDRQTTRMTKEEIAKAWAENPSANVGVVTGQVSGLIVLDVDDFKALNKAAPQMAAALSPAATVAALTGREGGVHLYFSHPGVQLGNFAKKLPGLDGRSDGGYVVAPPSRHASGKQYGWAAEKGLDKPLSPAPDAVLSLFERQGSADAAPGLPLQPTRSAPVQASPRGAVALRDELAAVERAPEGERNNTFNRSAFNLAQLVHAGELDGNQVRADLTAAAARIGLTGDEVRKTLDSAFQGAAHKPRQAALLGATSLSSAVEIYPFELFGNIEADLSDMWLMQDFLPLSGIGLIVGAPGRGKSFLALDIGLSVATGRPCGAREVKAGGVIYLSAEGQAGMRRRIKAARIHHNIPPDIPFVFVPASPDLLNGSDTSKLIATVEVARKAMGGDPVLIIIDTLARTFGGGQENDGQDMGRYISNATKLQEAFGGFVLVVHHTPKNPENNTPRGHGSLLGAVDTVIRVDEDKHGRYFRVDKQKDGEEVGGRFALLPIAIGEDGEGRPVMVPVVTYPLHSIRPKEPKGQAKELLDLIRSVTETHGDPQAIEDCAGQPAIRMELLQDEWKRAHPEAKDDTSRKAFNRAKDFLVREGHACEKSGFIWLPASVPMNFNPAAGHPASDDHETETDCAESDGTDGHP